MSRKQLVLATVAVILTASALYFLAPTPISQQSNLTKDGLTCIARSTIVARGQDWVDKHVPYNQGATHDGYRTDCSGFVSMAWQLAKPGLTTFTMHTVAGNIAKDQLAAGDAINCDSQHIVLFQKWSDSSKTHYVSMQEANSRQGTVKRVTPYPYWSNVGCFHPIRYHNVC